MQIMKILLLFLFFCTGSLLIMPKGFTDLKFQGYRGKIKTISNITYEGNKLNFKISDSTQWIKKDIFEYNSVGFLLMHREIQNNPGGEYELITKYVHSDSGAVSTTYHGSDLINMTVTNWLTDSSFEIIQKDQKGRLQVYTIQVIDKNFKLRSGEMKYYAKPDSVAYHERYEVLFDEKSKSEKTIASVFPRINNKLVMRDFKKPDKHGNPTEIDLMQNGLRLGFRRTFSDYIYYP